MGSAASKAIPPQQMALNVLVWGGSGMVGSAVCKAAVGRGWNVTSISRSGRPFATPQGHSPAWVKKVDWRRGSPFDTTSYSDLLPSCGAVVSTLGILLEGNYKKNGMVSPLELLKGVVDGITGNRGNPLSAERMPSYEEMNRDAGVTIFRELAKSKHTPSLTAPTPFVFLSAEDIFRPIIPSRYIETKREAESIITIESALEAFSRSVRPLFVRPSLIYHPHINPTSTLPATLLSASATMQSLLPPALRASHIFPPSPSAPGQFIPSPTSSLASLMTLPPIHADTIAEAICQGIEDPTVSGVMDVWEMRRRVGFLDERGGKAQGEEKVVGRTTL